MQTEGRIELTNFHPHKTLDLKGAASFLGIHKETLRERAACGEIPGAKVGKSWRFLEDDLVNYLRSLYSAPVSQGANNRRTVWHSTNENLSIGLDLHTTASAYRKALGLETKSLPRKCTTN